METLNSGRKFSADWPQSSIRQRNIGRALKEAREGLGYNLRELERKLKEARHPMSASHLSRIENAAVDVGVGELEALCRVLGVPTDSIWSPEKEPWYVVRRSAAEKMLSEIQSGALMITKFEPAHRQLIEEHVYSYATLEDSLSNEREGTLKPVMRGYLFDVSRASKSQIETPGALGQHIGEELIFVLEGELDFWCRQTQDGPLGPPLRLVPFDCLHFSSRLLHAFSAAGTAERARALFVYAQTPVPETNKHVDVGSVNEGN
jgi:transcriptional regulator with XRE-family HTH domain